MVSTWMDHRGVACWAHQQSNPKHNISKPAQSDPMGHDVNEPSGFRPTQNWFNDWHPTLVGLFLTYYNANKSNISLKQFIHHLILKSLESLPLRHFRSQFQLDRRRPLSSRACLQVLRGWWGGDQSEDSAVMFTTCGSMREDILLSTLGARHKLQQTWYLHYQGHCHWNWALQVFTLWFGGTRLQLVFLVHMLISARLLIVDHIWLYEIACDSIIKGSRKVS